jgi:glycerol kinase
MNRYTLGLDQGTTGTFAGLMNAEGVLVSSAYLAHQQQYPQPGWVEQDPNELWRNTCHLLNRVIDEAKIPACEIYGLGIANQGESILLWDRETGEPLSPVIVWQDTRTQSEIDRLAANAEIVQQVEKRTGLKLDSYFSASKIRWLLDNVPAVPDRLRTNKLACGTLDTWLIWNLTEGSTFVTDHSTASRTLLFNIYRLEWDEWLLKLFDIPREILPSIQESSGVFGHVSHPDLKCRNVPVIASVVDQPAAMIGQGCLDAGQIKATYGTGCFINLNTGANPIISHHGLLTMLAWQRDSSPTYGLDGGVFTAAASLNWLCDKLKLVSEIQFIDKLCENLPDSGGVVWIPAQIGLGAPYWNRLMRGAWFGIDLATTQAQLVRAVVEGVAARVTQIVEAMRQDTGLAIKILRVDGGLTASRILGQIQADLLGIPVEVVKETESTTIGVCTLAARASGLWTHDDMIRQRVQIATTYEPVISEDQRLYTLARFDRAIRHLEAWHRDE